HEALLRDWPRLGRWIDQVRDDVRVSRRLEQAAAEWHGNDRASAYLLRAGRLAQAESHLDSTSVVAGSLVREFVSTSRELVDVETEQRRRRRRRVTAGFGIAAVVSLLLAVVAFIAQQQSANSAAVARSRELALAATAPEVLSVDSELSLLLALASARTAEPSVETITALHEAIAQHRTVFRYSWPEGQDYWVVGGDLSDDGSLLVSWALFGDYLEVVSIPDGSLRWSKEFPGRSASHAFFVADGTEVAVGVSSRPGSDATEDDVGLFLLDAATGEVVHHERFGNCGAELPDTAAGVSDGRLLVFGQPGADCSRDEGGFDKYDRWSIFSFDLATSSLVKLSDEFQASSGRAAISGDGTVAAVLSARSLMELYDTTTGERLDSVGAALLQSFALDSDGSRALNGSSDGVRVIDTGSAADLALFEGHDELPWGAWFSNDGSVAFSSGGDGFVRVWDPATGEEILAVPGGGFPWLSAMTDDGSRIASFDSGGEARILDMTVDTGVEISKGTGKPNPIRASASNESRRSVRLTSEDGAVRVTTDENGQTFYVRGTGSRELAVSAGPDGPPVPRQQAAIIPGTHQVVLGFLDKIVRVDGDTMSIEATRRWSEGALPVAWLTPSPDGSFIVGTGAGFVSGRRNPESLNFLAEGSYLAGEPVVEIMDPWTLETIIRIDKAHTDTIVDLAVSSDGSLVASGSRDRFARVWSSSDGALVHAIPAPGPVHGVEFTADDRHLMVILENGDAY
ncbi:MAG: WD40 repeat domain-containing protein, partial [Actinomycetota bacterium]|nr:WD40 repeat domain-containing protein [Actinomycetota bacterium]